MICGLISVKYKNKVEKWYTHLFITILSLDLLDLHSQDHGQDHRFLEMIRSWYPLIEIHTTSNSGCYQNFQDLWEYFELIWKKVTSFILSLIEQQ